MIAAAGGLVLLVCMFLPWFSGELSGRGRAAVVVPTTTGWESYSGVFDLTFVVLAVTQMLAVGEDTGALDTMLYKIGEFFDNEVEAMTESLTALMEPLMIAFLGGIVGSMIVALYMPIFKIFDLIK